MVNDGRLEGGVVVTVIEANDKREGHRTGAKDIKALEVLRLRRRQKHNVCVHPVLVSWPAKELEFVDFLSAVIDTTGKLQA